MIMLKGRYRYKLILGHVSFQLVPELTFSLKLYLLLNHSIGWQWLLFDLLTEDRRKI